MMKLILLLLLSFYFNKGQSSLNPAITSWIKSSGYNGYGGVLADVTKIQYSSSYVYVTANGVPGTYTVGPTWKANPGTPSAQNYLFKIPLNPTKATTKKTLIDMGTIGMLVNGVSTG